MRRRLEVREQVREEVVRVRRPRVPVAGLGLVSRGLGVAVGEDDDLVDAEDREGAGDVPRHRGAEVVGLCTSVRVSWEQISRERMDAYLEIMLPGRATLTVQSRPSVGLKIAVGLEVSVAALFGVPLEEDLASAWRLRFCNQSAREPIFQQASISPTFAFVSPRPMVVILCFLEL